MATNYSGKMNKRTRYDAIRTMPTVIGNRHESVYRAFQILKEVKRLIAEGVPAIIVGELIEEMEGDPLSVAEEPIQMPVGFFTSRVPFNTVDSTRDMFATSARATFSVGDSNRLFKTVGHRLDWEKAGRPEPLFKIDDLLRVRKNAQEKGGPRLGSVKRYFWGWRNRDDSIFPCWVYELHGYEFAMAPGSPIIQFPEDVLKRATDPQDESLDEKGQSDKESDQRTRGE